MYDLDEQQLDAFIPNWQALDHDPQFAAWLNGIDKPSGRVREQRLAHMIRSGSWPAAAAFIEGFHWQQSQRSGSMFAKPTYSREQIRQAYEAHRRGAYNGREAEWDRLERDIVAASREGRVLNPVPLAKNYGDSR